MGEDLLNFGSIDERMLEFLRVAVRERRNLVVTGGYGFGQDQADECAVQLLPDHERIVTIEDVAELKLNQPNLVGLEARLANLEGKGLITIRDLVRNALRIRPDPHHRRRVQWRRGPGHAAGPGHEGSMTTAHANSPRDALSRLEVMVLMFEHGPADDNGARADRLRAGPDRAPAALLLRVAKDHAYQRDHRHRVRDHPVAGHLQDIFIFRVRDQSGRGDKVRGEFIPAGAVPEFYEELTERGVRWTCRSSGREGA